jgi:hypothetical protein
MDHETEISRTSAQIRHIPVLSSAPFGFVQPTCAGLTAGNMYKTLAGVQERKPALVSSLHSVQPKLMIGQPDDPYEREADQVAERVMRMPDRPNEANFEPSRAGKSLPALSFTDEVVQSTGKSLDSSTRHIMESRFGHDFSRVRVYADTKAAEFAEMLNARAYTTAEDIVFNKGEYSPKTPGGLKLLAHELAHVVQQERFEGNVDFGNFQDRLINENNSSHNYPTGNDRQGGLWTIYRQAKGSDKDTEKKNQVPQKNEFKFCIPPAQLDERLLSLGPEKPGTTSDDAKMPSRLSLFNMGRLSFGLRWNFPGPPEPSELQQRLLAGAPNPLELLDQRAKIIDQVITGKVPSGWDETDKGKLPEAIWGIFRTNIAPDFARRITSAMSASSGPGGPSVNLDFTVITDLKSEIGGGLSLTVNF